MSSESTSDELGPDPPASTSSTSIEWNGPRRRSVGEPGLRSQTPSCRSTSGRCVWPKTHRVAAGEAADEPLLPPGRRPGDVHHPDPRAAELDDELLRQELRSAGSSTFPCTACTGGPSARSSSSTRRSRSRRRGGSGRRPRAARDTPRGAVWLPEAGACPRSPRRSPRRARLVLRSSSSAACASSAPSCRLRLRLRAAARSADLDGDQ